LIDLIFAHAALGLKEIDDLGPHCLQRWLIVWSVSLSVKEKLLGFLKFSSQLPLIKYGIKVRLNEFLEYTDNSRDLVCPVALSG
jgi:hypothetical protein